MSWSEGQCVWKGEPFLALCFFFQSKDVSSWSIWKFLRNKKNTNTRAWKTNKVFKNHLFYLILYISWDSWYVVINFSNNGSQCISNSCSNKCKKHSNIKIPRSCKICLFFTEKGNKRTQLFFNDLGSWPSGVDFGQSRFL